MGDGRFNMGRSLLVMGAIMGSDVRICAPPSCSRPRTCRRWPASAPSRERRDGHDHRRPAARRSPGVDFVHTDVWVSMGEPKEVWDERVELLRPYQVNAARARARPATRGSSSCTACPAFHDDEHRSSAREIIEQTGMTEGLEVTDDVFESPASIVFDQAENRLHTIKAVLVATLGQ